MIKTGFYGTFSVIVAHPSILSHFVSYVTSSYVLYRSYLSQILLLGKKGNEDINENLKNNESYNVWKN